MVSATVSAGAELSLQGGKSLVDQAVFIECDGPLPSDIGPPVLYLRPAQLPSIVCVERSSGQHASVAQTGLESPCLLVEDLHEHREFPLCPTSHGRIRP